MTREQSTHVYSMIIAQLKREGAKARQRADACDRALAALNGHVPHGKSRKQAKRKRTSRGPISAQGKRRIRGAQKARWAAWHALQAKAAHKLAAKGA